MTTREVKESPVYQGEDEEISYTFDFTTWGSTPTSPTVVLKGPGGVDLSSTHLSGTASVDGNVVTTPKVIDLVRDRKYRLECKVTISGNIEEAFCEIIGEE